MELDDTQDLLDEPEGPIMSPQKRMRFDGTITLGNIIQVLVICAVCVGALIRSAALEVKVDDRLSLLESQTAKYDRVQQDIVTRFEENQRTMTASINALSQALIRFETIYSERARYHSNIDNNDQSGKSGSGH